MRTVPSVCKMAKIMGKIARSLRGSRASDARCYRVSGHAIMISGTPNPMTSNDSGAPRRA
jgi:hypothetical protein